MADPTAMLRARREEVEALTRRARHRTLASVHRAADQIAHLRAQVRTLSPLSTLERGYAVVQHRDGHVVMDPGEVEVDELLRVQVARGDFAAARGSPGGAVGGSP